MRRFTMNPCGRSCARAASHVAFAAFAFTCTLGVSAARAADPLQYARGYLLTGNYVAAGVDLTPQSNPADKNGLSTGTIHINGVPADADIVAAYLYFETVTYKSSLSDAKA